jgi:hypothetical protein
MLTISYRGYRFPPDVIQRAVWLYLRFTLSFRDVEDLLAERNAFCPATPPSTTRSTSADIGQPRRHTAACVMRRSPRGAMPSVPQADQGSSVRLAVGVINNVTSPDEIIVADSQRNRLQVYRKIRDYVDFQADL